jgi:secreted trypsin-like serine protease
MHRFLLSFFYLTGLLFSTLSESETPRIVGGTPVAVGDYPFFAWSAGSTLCGASLIHEDILLSAAHCEGAFIENGVLMGGIVLYGSDSAADIQVERELMHPDYTGIEVTGVEVNDVMLVKLAGPAPVGRDVALVTLNFDPCVPANDEPVTVIGYGRTSEDGPLSDVLLKADLSTVDSSECQEFWGSHLDQETMVCAGVDEGGRDSCQV